MDTLNDFIEETYGIRKTPTYIADRCTDRKTIGPSCQICADICPQNIYPYGKRKRPIWDQCLKCGLCSAACPADCITVPSRRVESYMLALAGKGRLTISCEREDPGARLMVRCAASVSWEQLAAAALMKGVIISLRRCGECKDELCKNITEGNIEKLKFFLGDKVFESSVTILRDGDGAISSEDSQEVVSRRNFLSIFGNLSVDRAYSMLPAIDEPRDNGLIFRALLRDTVLKKTGGDGEKYCVMMPRFTENCYNCGYCASACPNGALKFIQDSENFTVTVDVWKCTSCGLCERQCRVGGISKMTAMRVSTLGTVAIARIKNHLCPVCGKPYSYKEESDYERCKFCETRKVNEKRRSEENRRNSSKKINMEKHDDEIANDVK